jgi:UDP-N-acetylglucosamine 2-epimerase (non-hydrolysing)
VTAILAVAGARPNFVKLAPLVAELRARPGVDLNLLHTGQHYEHALSQALIDRLSLPEPDFHLGVGSGTHAQQTAAVMVGVERVLAEDGFDAVIVAGDVNSTLGGALAAVKLRVPIVHLESGLRSGDWTMPEEVNRTLTDRVSDLLLCHSQDAVENLAREGIAGDHVQLVGNTMIDSLMALLPAARADGAVERLGLAPGEYVLATLHRPALVDDPHLLEATLAALGEVANRMPVVLPMHPRTRAALDARPLPHAEALKLLGPLDYLEFIGLEAQAALVVTDSGGVQEETSALGVPCLTYRDTTERPITVAMGTNRVVGLDPAALAAACHDALAAGRPAAAPQIPLWDGHAGARAADAVTELLRAVA